MNKKNKVIILASIIIGVLVVTLGLTYAVLSFNETGGNSQLVLGDIWMHYGETNQINLQNAIPTESYIPNGYFEFTIDGKNTYTKKDIWYEIVLNHGDDHETRTTRIRDDLLKFRLVEVNNNVETELFTNKSYNSLTNKRIWVDTISKNTTSEINKTYRLYMWISNDAKVGNTSDADYDNETWNEDVYGSIRVSVTGDFNEKELAYEDKYNVTDASCFETEETKFYEHNSNISDEEVELCVTIFRDEWQWSLAEGEDWISFCQGTGTREGNTFQSVIDGGWLLKKELTYLEENNIIMSYNSVLGITDYNTSCGNNVVIPKKINGWTVTTIESYAFEAKQLTSIVIPNSVTDIENVSFNNNQIKNLTFEDDSSVKYIGEGAFSYNQLTSVVIPDSVEYIGEGAFSYNQLTSVVIPDSVEYIGGDAFFDNQLTSVIFENNSQLLKIDTSAFRGYNHTIETITIPDSVTYLSCTAFNDDVTIIKNEDLVCTEPGAPA